MTMNESISPDTVPVRALAGVFGGLFCGYLGLAAVIPVLPAYVRDGFGASDMLVGLVVTATALAAVLARPWAGQLADGRGARLVMQIGALIVAGGGLGYFLPLGLAGLVVVRLVIGLGEAALFTAGAAWTMALAPHHRRGQLIGLYGVSMWGGISVGTFSGAQLALFGILPVWIFSTAVPLVGWVLITLTPRPAGPAAGGVKRGLLLRPTLVPGLSLALAAAGYAALSSFIVLFLTSRGIGSGVIVLTVFSACYAGTRLFIGHFPDRFGPRRVAAWAGGGEALGLVIIAVAPNLALAVAGSVVMGVGFSLLHPSLALMVMDVTEKPRQGAALGTYTAFWDLGLGFWGPATGAIAGTFGYFATFLFAAVCALAAVGLALAARSLTPGLALKPLESGARGHG